MRNSTLLVAILAMIAGFAVARLVTPDLHNTATASPVPAPLVLPDGLTEEEERTIAVFRRANSSVVNITSVALRRDFFTLDLFQIPQGTGSGFVWDVQGHVVTNYHVIEDGQAFLVTLADHSEWDAELVGVAPEKDLAVLRIDAPARLLSPLPLGTSRDLMVGQSVLAVGNPFGLDQSLTVGVVSALDRELQSPSGRIIRDVIQTDAAINPGNSGGPLLDSSGGLIGVNSAIYSPSGASAGIGFAVPVDTVRRLVPQLIKHGRAVLPGIGVSILSNSWADRFQVTGAVIYRVVEGGPADRAGLEGIRMSRSGRPVLGDRIIAVNDEPIESHDDLAHAFERAGVGAKVTLTMMHDGRERRVDIVLVRVD